MISRSRCSFLVATFLYCAIPVSAQEPLGEYPFRRRSPVRIRLQGVSTMGIGAPGQMQENRWETDVTWKLQVLKKLRGKGARLRLVAERIKALRQAFLEGTDTYDSELHAPDSPEARELSLPHSALSVQVACCLTQPSRSFMGSNIALICSLASS